MEIVLHILNLFMNVLLFFLFESPIDGGRLQSRNKTQPGCD